MQLIGLTVLAVIFGFILMCGHMILPWLFGPIAAAIVISRYSKQPLKWPPILGDIGLFVLGAQIGTSFTRKIAADIKDDLVSIVVLNILILAAALLLSFLFKWIVGCTFETALLSSIPGALSQMVVMAEENSRANLLIVTLTQTSRLLFVIMLVPMISSFHSEGSKHLIRTAPSIFAVLNIQSLIILIAATAALYYLLKSIHSPVPQLLAPIAVVITWNMTINIDFTIPYILIAAAQVLFGIRIGIQMYSLSHQLTKKLFLGMLVQNLSLIGCTLILTALFTQLTQHGFNDLFLSAAPGGMAQIIIVGLETGANVAMISSYHIFRLFFILLILSPIVQWTLRCRDIDNHV